MTEPLKFKNQRQVSRSNSGNDKETRVLVTRPAHQSSHFVKLLENEGFKVVQLPSISIEFESVDLTETLQSDLIIFTSANAVTGANKSLQFPWRSNARIAAIGKPTAELLALQKCPVDVVPHSGASTEALLDALPEVIGPIANLNVTIIRGDSGRDKLHDLLSDQGARPRYQSVYKRSIPKYSPEHVKSVLENGVPDIVSVTSDLGLSNLLALIPDGFSESLLGTPLVVNSQRCAQLAQARGFSAEILVADPPGDSSQLAKILSLCS